MKVKAEAPISRLLLESTTKEELEEFISNEFQIAFKEKIIELYKEREDEILYGTDFKL